MSTFLIGLDVRIHNLVVWADVQCWVQIILMAGLQGVGKTTACGKLALYLQKQGKKVRCSTSLETCAALIY